MEGHRETLADLSAIGGAVRKLADLSGIPAGSVAPAPHRKVAAGMTHTAARGGGKILIADDDDANRDLLRRRLVCEGHEVLEARSGLEVLALLKESACDLVLLDILMPDLDGFQTLARIKQDPQLRELPVIMISALEELQSVVRVSNGSGGIICQSRSTVCCCGPESGQAWSGSGWWTGSGGKRRNWSAR